MKRLIFAAALTLVLAAIGCNRDPKESIVAPSFASDAHLIPADAVRLIVQAWVRRDPKDGHIAELSEASAFGASPGDGWELATFGVWAVHEKGSPQGMFRVLYICDWVRGSMYGPPGPGHCWDDGGGCTPGFGNPDPYTAYFIGDPDGSGVRHLGDPDATGNKAAPFYQPPDKGDPTADDARKGDPDADESNADGDGTVVK